jgi:heptosyltransferase III
MLSAMLRDAIDLTQINHALVVILGHHGDVLLTSPVFQVLKNHAPHAKIDALLYGETAPMLTLHPAIDSVFSIDRNWKQEQPWTRLRREFNLFSSLRSRRYDLIVHLSGNPRGPWLKRLLRIRYGIAPKINGRSRAAWKSFTHFFPLADRRHMVERNLDALRRVGIIPAFEERRLILEPGEAAEETVQTLMRDHGLKPKGFVQFHGGSRWMFKTWPSDKIATLLNRLVEGGYVIALTGAPDDQEMMMVKQVLSLLEVNIVNLAGRLTLKQLAALSAQAALFVGVDSAPMHIAAAVGTPVVALFGPSSEITWGPWMVEHRVVTSNHACRPCGYDGCGGGKLSECLTTLPVERVLAAVREINKR